MNITFLWPDVSKIILKIFDIFWTKIVSWVRRHTGLACIKSDQIGDFQDYFWGLDPQENNLQHQMGITKLLCRISIWRFPKLGVPPKSSILKGFSSINQHFLGTPVYGNLHMLMIRMCWIRFLWCAAEHSACFTKSTHPNSVAMENHVFALQRIINHLDSSRNLVYTWAYMGRFPHVTIYQKLIEIMKIPWKIPLDFILYLMILYSYIPIKPINNPILFLLPFFPCLKAPHFGDPNIRPHEFRLFLRGDQFEVTHRSRRWTSPSRKGVHAEHMDGKKKH